MGTIMTMSSDETNSFELLMNNMLLKQEQRLNDNVTSKLDAQTEKITKTVHDQNQLFSGNILSLTRDVAKLEEKVRVQSVKMITLAAAASVLGGIVGFFIDHVV
mgnify:CR=1 FL=1